MRKGQIRIGGIHRQTAMLCAGYIMGLSVRNNAVLDKSDRKILKSASKALAAACKELWPDWFE